MIELNEIESDERILLEIATCRPPTLSDRNAGSNIGPPTVSKTT